MTFDRYDTKGNLLQHHKEDDANVSYIWGYNKTYPIAKIENADYSTVEAVLGGATSVDNFATTANPTDAQVRSFLAALYTDSRLAKAMVSTYTYKPLVGMTSSTNPDGFTSYYEYDAFGRLKTVRDHDNNIVKTYSYHYRE
jgi:YD repeat-containing protein